MCRFVHSRYQWLLYVTGRQQDAIAQRNLDLRL